jgi:hypothetical protein
MWTAKRLSIVNLVEATVDSLLRKRKSTMSLVSMIEDSYPGDVFMSGYFETCHIAPFVRLFILNSLVGVVGPSFPMYLAVMLCYF